ncbi:hypothetical protein D3C73_378250 [compost metagenome]|jgi:hypothetical protein
MARNTPPMNISGPFLLRAPFVADPTKSYTVTAHRSFSELIARSQDVLKLVYNPVGLTATAYVEDQIEGAIVIALRDSAGNVLYVPDTYVESYPGLGSVPYSRLIGVVDLGMWANYRDLDDVMASLKEACKGNLGVDVEVTLARGSVTNSITEEQHIQITAAREAAKTNNETSTATIIRLSDELAARDATIAEQATLIEALAGTPTP